MISQSRLFFITFILLCLFDFTPISTQAKATKATLTPVEPSMRLKRDSINPSEIPHVFGSVLWDNNLGISPCLTARDRTLLTTRLAMDKLLQNLVRVFPQSDEELDAVWEYLKNIYLGVKHVPVSLTAFYDAVGGYLKSHLLPMIRISFYAGNVSLSSTRRIVTLYDHCKSYLDTQGHGWLGPAHELVNYSPSILPLLLNASTNECNELVTLDDEDDESSQLVIALPKVELEDNGKELVNILLPFRRRRVFNLRSKLSSFVFVRYFVAATKCHEIAQIDQDEFNRKLYHWTRDNLVPHLIDEQLYPGLGGVLRVLRTMKTTDLDLKALNLTTSKLVTKTSARKKERGHSKPAKTYTEVVSWDDDKNTEITTENEFVKFEKEDEKDQELQSSVKKFEDMFTPVMMWISIIAFIGSTLLGFAFCCLRKWAHKSRSQTDLQQDPPEHRPSKKSKSRKESKKRVDTIYTRRPSDHDTSSTVFSASLTTRPKDYIHPVPTSTEINERKSSEVGQKARRSFISNPTQRRNFGGGAGTTKFKLNSDSESEEEIYSPRQAVETKDLTKKPSVNTGPSTSKESAALIEKVIKEEHGPSKREVGGLVISRTNLYEEVIEVGETRQQIRVNRRSKSLESRSRSQSTISIERKKYNFESCGWETVSESLNSA